MILFLKESFYRRDGALRYGFLQTVYAHDFAGDKAQYFRRFQSDRGEPVTIISRSKSVEHAEFLNHAHFRIKEYHKTGMPYATKQSYMGHLATNKVNDIIDTSPAPDFAVLATWSTATYGAGGGWHGWTNLDQLTKAKMPLNTHGIHVINEAFSNVQGWAEGSLQLADSVLKSYFNVDHPWNFTVEDRPQRVAQTSATADCAAAGPTGTGAPAAPMAAPTAASDFDACFVAGTLVKMADGSHSPIESVREGDVVRTGGAGRGVVTKALVHPLDLKEGNDVEVAILNGIAGTPSHPVFDAASGTWIEMRDHVTAKVERRFSAQVKNFYNLEIDGDAPGDSLHAYVLVGDDSASSEIIASGLGDHEELNRRHPRQMAWRELVARELVTPPLAAACPPTSSKSKARVHDGSTFPTAPRHAVLANTMTGVK